MRTIHPESFTKEKLMVVEDEILSPKETELVIWCSGKNTIEENARNLGLSMDECIQLLRGLENRRLIVFSEF